MCGFLCIFRAFPVCALCSCVFSFLQSLPPQPFLRSNSSRCSIASSILSLCVPLFLCFLLFAILAAPFIFPFQFVPLLQCVFHAFLVCVFCPVVSVFPVSVPPPFLQPLPLPLSLIHI